MLNLKLYIVIRIEAVVGVVGASGGGDDSKSEEQPSKLPMHLSPRCQARTRAGRPTVGKDLRVRSMLDEEAAEAEAAAVERPG
jgi:hypothetical protein